MMPKNHSKILAIQQHIKKIIYLDQFGFFPKDAGMVQRTQTEVYIHTLTSIDVEKAFGKIQPPFMIKTSNKMGVEATYLNIIQATYKQAYSQHHIEWEKLEAFPLRLRQGCPLS